MRIFRHRHMQVFVALLAFAMQAVLAFADTHTHGTPRSFTALHAATRHAAAQHAATLHADGSLASRAVTYGICRAGADQQCPAPAQDDDRNCPLCASLALAGAAVLNVPPPLPVRDVIIAPPAPAHLAALALDGETVHFQARAPPRLA
jgi:hypothetical protein